MHSKRKSLYQMHQCRGLSKSGSGADFLTIEVEQSF